MINIFLGIFFMPQKYIAITIEEMRIYQQRLAELTRDVSTVLSEMETRRFKSLDMLWSSKDKASFSRAIMLGKIAMSALSERVSQVELGVPNQTEKRKKHAEYLKKWREKQAKERDKKP